MGFRLWQYVCLCPCPAFLWLRARTPERFPDFCWWDLCSSPSMSLYFLITLQVFLTIVLKRIAFIVKVPLHQVVQIRQIYEFTPLVFPCHQALCWWIYCLSTPMETFLSCMTSGLGSGPMYFFEQSYTPNLDRSWWLSRLEAEGNRLRSWAELTVSKGTAACSAQLSTAKLDWLSRFEPSCGNTKKQA